MRIIHSIIFIIEGDNLDFGFWFWKWGLLNTDESRYQHGRKAILVVLCSYFWADPLWCYVRTRCVFLHITQSNCYRSHQQSVVSSSAINHQPYFQVVTTSPEKITRWRVSINSLSLHRPTTFKPNLYYIITSSYNIIIRAIFFFWPYFDKKSIFCQNCAFLRSKFQYSW